MPRVVDENERTKAIASAALAIARADGLAAVTFRAVAAKMGASSTTVVTHYAPVRRDLIALMLAELFGAAEEVADAVLPELEPRYALRLLTERVLPLDEDSRTMANLALDAARDLGADGGLGSGLEGWGQWLETRIGSLVAAIGSPAGPEVATDLILAALAGITLYGLVDPDHWPAARQRQALHGLLNTLGLD